MEIALVDLRKVFLKLSRDVRRCEQCAYAGSCPVLSDYYARVKAGRDRALAEFDRALAEEAAVSTPGR